MDEEEIEDVNKKILASIQHPQIGEAGKTGSWRTKHPVIDLSKCIVAVKGEHNCHFCWLYCPEAVITRDIPPKIDYEYCKGCGICAVECPHHAIEMEEETKEVKNNA